MIICDNCDYEIPAGTEYSCVDVHREVYYADAIRVIHAVSVLTLCDDCAAERDFGRIIVPVKS